MLTKIKEKEIITMWEAMNKYRDKYFHFVVTEVVDRINKDRGYVIYTYDQKHEMRGIPREEIEGYRSKGIVVAKSLGVAAEKEFYIGGLTTL
ncbi:MAG: hypothetical protein FWG63_08600 [Defluviitaleaceae bacterium]|nr:hypothetical protein [Defluviitaleaceae bacterium]